MTSSKSSSDDANRRYVKRKDVAALARVIRATDAMRIGIEGDLQDVSVDGLKVLLDVELDLAEEVSVEIENTIQRFAKKTRGVVRHVSQTDDGRWATGIELRVRLTPYELSHLRLRRPDNDGPIWM